MRIDNPTAPPVPALVLSFLGGAFALGTAWLGGELVDRLAIGVDDDAHVNAGSSLERRHSFIAADSPRRTGRVE
jgi:hypothetical protein